MIDFRGATGHFADPDFDGEPEQIYEPGEDDPMIPPADDRDMVEYERGEYGDGGTILDDWPDPDPPGAGGGTLKIYVDGVSATIVAERVEYLDENGKLVTESLRDFTKRALRNRFASLDDFLKRWNAAERKQESCPMRHEPERRA